jgi:hypothetical protein
MLPMFGKEMAIIIFVIEASPEGAPFLVSRKFYP